MKSLKARVRGPERLPSRKEAAQHHGELLLFEKV